MCLISIFPFLSARLVSLTFLKATTVQVQLSEIRLESYMHTSGISAVTEKNCRELVTCFTLFECALPNFYLFFSDCSVLIHTEGHGITVH